MRILHVVDSLDHHPGRFPSALPGLIAALNEHDIVCDIASGATHDTHMPKQSPAQNIVVVDEDQAIESISMIAPLVARADVVHIHCPTATIGAIAAASANSQQTPFVLSTHGSLTTHLRERGKLSTWFENRSFAKKFKKAHAVTCLTSSEGQLLRQRGIRIEAKPLAVGCDFSLEDPLCEDSQAAGKLPIADGKRIIAYFGDIDGQLGLIPFFKACDELEDDLEAWRIVIAGRPVDNWLEQFQAGARRHGKEHLGEFVVFPNIAQQCSILSAAEIVVAPSPTPIPPVAPMWAMWHGTATVVSDALGLNGVEEANAGAVVEPTRKGFLAALSKLVTSTPEDLHQMGRRAATFVREKHSWKTNVAEYIELYRAAAATNG
ncbi:MAG: glycosyltransferase family 4 protein [Planctomycetes bacterium]|nr:glycosyltransferase family 4 protein [Planctomycetota bacterium]